ncbi:MAG: T9SS C-terminal target domain-containing protein, partial [Bacteroidia bacterium]|nr:T9SS C-terminal target domain-containing protein [Bacteroidia bacterium]
NHYHCANIPLYDESKNEMHTIFFGGIAQYYDSLGSLIQDNNVPFVKTIARVTRTANGTMMEYKLPGEMPGLLGAGSEFIPIEGLPVYANEVIKYDSINTDTTMLGYIFGGINSSAQNIFWINDGTQSNASDVMYKVHVIKNLSTDINDQNNQKGDNLNMKVYPNPNSGIINVDFNLRYSSSVQIHLSDITGKLISQLDYPKNRFVVGKNHLEIKLDSSVQLAPAFLTLITNKEKITQSILSKP